MNTFNIIQNNSSLMIRNPQLRLWRLIARNSIMLTGALMIALAIFSFFARYNPVSVGVFGLGLLFIVFAFRVSIPKQPRSSPKKKALIKDANNDELSDEFIEMANGLSGADITSTFYHLVRRDDD